MQTNTPEQNYYQEDEIDLKELFGILWAKKTLIIGITTLITVFAGIYAFNKTPIYEATALVEIGSYKFHNTVFINNNNNNNNNNNKIQIENAFDLSIKLNTLFPNINSSSPNKTNSFINLKSESTSQELATNNIKEVIKYITTLHQKNLNKTKLELQSVKGNLVYNFNNSLIIGDIDASKNPIKPKKELIVAVAFVAGFILSIFLVFIMNAFRKEEDTVTA